MTKTEINYLIVGGGIAGSLLAYNLYKAGKQVRLIQTSMKGEASSVSAGLINPITGKRFVKTWNWEVIQQHFLECYRSLEKDWDCTLLKPISIYQYLDSVEEENQCASRMLDGEYKDYLEFEYMPTSKGSEFPLLKIKTAFLLDINLVLEKVLNFFKNLNLVTNEKMEYTDLDPSSMIWKDFQILDGVVFTEGSFAMDNPFFNHLPFMAVKGHRSIVSSDSYAFGQDVFKLDYSIIPIANSKYWIGSNYEFNNRAIDLLESEIKSQNDFINSCNLFLKEVNIENQSIGIRPAMKDRRPVIGSHPEFNKLFILNGLGTKGSSLAPYCVYQMVKFLLNGENIDKEVSIKRFNSK